VNPFIWLYRRIGQIVCFSASALALVSAFFTATDGDAGALPLAIIGSALLLAGVGLRAVRVWQTIDDPLG